MLLLAVPVRLATDACAGADLRAAAAAAFCSAAGAVPAAALLGMLGLGVVSSVGLCIWEVSLLLLLLLILPAAVLRGTPTGGGLISSRCLGGGGGTPGADGVVLSTADCRLQYCVLAALVFGVGDGGIPGSGTAVL